MTITSTTSRVDYVGNGVTTAFAVPFAFFGASELAVIQRVIATGVETTLALSTHYTVSGGNGTTGTVTAVTAPASTVQWTILRATARTQEVDYQSNDPFPAETHERALDRLTAIAQEVERDAARAVRVAPTDAGTVTLPSSVARAGLYLAFDGAGAPIAVVGTAGPPVTPFAATLLDDMGAAQVRATLEAGATGDALFLAAAPGAARTELGIRAAPQIVAEAVANNSAALDVTAGLDDTFDRYEVEILSLVPASNDVSLALRVGTGAGPTWQAGASAYDTNGQLITGSVAFLGGFGNGIFLSAAGGGTVGVGNQAGNSISGIVELCNPEANLVPTFRFRTSYLRPTGNGAAAVSGAGYYGTSGAITGLRVLFSSGNIVSGRIRLIGYHKG
jgi:hypothetical protein